MPDPDNCPLPGVEFKTIHANGIRMRIAMAGSENRDGRLCLLAHGWPESWYNWRHQIPFLVEQGYRVAVPDMRGYGETEAPAEVQAYDIRSLSDDMAGILDALGEEQAIMIGHDWGAIVAWHAVLFYPGRFSALIAMSVPYAGRPAESLYESYRKRHGENFFYMLYHNAPGGIAEKEYDADPHGIISRLYLSPDSPREAPVIADRHHSAGGWIGRLGAPKGLPSWLSADDLAYVVDQFSRSGFRGGVNYYRNLHRNWEITADLDPVVRVPTLFIAGEKDMVIHGASKEQLAAAIGRVVPDLRGVELFPGIGHWVQQEAPQQTNAAMASFLRGL
jgi:pimeloyl-ACP methyl ester carboxylesterase